MAREAMTTEPETPTPEVPSAPQPEKKTRGRGRPPVWDERHVELAIDLLARHLPKSEVKKELRRRIKRDNPRIRGDAHARTIEVIISRARSEMLANTGRPKDDHRGDVMAALDRIIADKSTKTRELLVALEAKRKMLGLDVPQQVQITGAGGGPIKCIIGSGGVNPVDGV